MTYTTWGLEALKEKHRLDRELAERIAEEKRSAAEQGQHDLALLSMDDADSEQMDEELAFVTQNLTARQTRDQMRESLDLYRLMRLKARSKRLKKRKGQAKKRVAALESFRAERKLARAQILERRNVTKATLPSVR